MECQICSYKTTRKWLLKRHHETNKKCIQMKNEKQTHIKYNSELELYKLRQIELKEQIHQLKIENYKLKLAILQNSSASPMRPLSFVNFRFTDLEKNQIKQVHKNIIEYNNFEQSIICLFKMLYLNCGIKITDDKNNDCNVFDNNEWIYVSFEQIIDDMWNCLIKPLFKEIKKDWCSYGHHKRLKKIIFNLCNDKQNVYSHIAHPSDPSADASSEDASSATLAALAGA